jgi:hypothetical protein
VNRRPTRRHRALSQPIARRSERDPLDGIEHFLADLVGEGANRQFQLSGRGDDVVFGARVDGPDGDDGLVERIDAAADTFAIR